MSYRFIIGASGSGKTHHTFSECIRESIADPKKIYMIIVPEQNTMQTQKDIVQMHPFHATGNIDVLSFNRLAQKIFRELNIERKEIMDDTGKALILKKIALGCKEDLKVWRNRLSKAGFIDHIKSMISELYQYDIREQDLQNLIKNSSNLRPGLLHKLQDIALLYTEFKEYIREKYITTEEVLDVCCKHLPFSKSLRGVHIILDGFTGFTPIQYRIVEIFLKEAASLTITVTAASKEEADMPITESDLFLMGKTMMQKISELAKRNKVERKEDMDLSARDFLLKNQDGQPCLPRFINSKALGHLQEHFLRYDRAEKISSDGNIRIWKAKTTGEEVNFIAAQIQRLVKEEGYRYRDIAIVTGDLEGYKDALSHRLSECEIPFYLDDSIVPEANPLIEWIRASIQMVMEDYSYDTVMMYLKFGPLKREKQAVRQMDLYMRECGIRSKSRFTKKWEYLPKDLVGIDLDAINALRDEVLSETEELYKAARSKKRNAKAIAAALKAMLEDLKIEEEVQQEYARFSGCLGQEDLRREREYAEIYQNVLRLLEQMEEILGEEILQKREFLEIFEAGVTQLKVGIIPAVVDNITIGDITRSRIGQIRCLFLAGANDGSLLIPKSSAGLLNDREKEEIKALGMELAPTMQEEMFMHRFYLYLTCTKMSEKLYITYKSMDDGGKSVKPSGLLRMIAELYTDVRAQEVRPEEHIYGRAEAKESWIRALHALSQEKQNADTERMGKVFPYISEAKALAEAANSRYQGTKISEKLAKELFGTQIRASATRFEEYADCPYKHFLQYGLKLHELRDFALDRSDVGNMAHGILEKVFSTSMEQGIDLTTAQESILEELVERCSAQILLEDEKSIYSDSFKSLHQASRIERMVKRVMWVLSRQLEKGDFVPFAIEKKFSGNEAHQTLTIPILGAQIRITGKIDRADIYETEEKVYVKVIDYKTGSTKWEADLPLYGRQMQLILYLTAMEEILSRKGKKVVPAALLYTRLDDAYIEPKEDIQRDSLQLGQAVKNSFLKELRPSGLVNEDPEIIAHLDRTMEKSSDVIPVTLKKEGIDRRYSSVADSEHIAYLQDRVKRKLKTIGEEMLDGKIDISPTKREKREICNYCPYGSVCGFDRKIKGFAFRDLKLLKDDEVWRILEEEKKETEKEEKKEEKKDGD